MTENTSLKTLMGLRTPGDQSAWQRVFPRLYRAADRAARKLPLSHHEREDVIADSFAAFLRRFRAGKYDESRGSLRTFMHCICESLGLNALKARRQDHALQEHLAVAMAERPNEGDAGIDANDVRREAYRAAITKVLSRPRLRGKTREVLRLSFAENRDPAEIAAVMKWTPERVYRIRTRYRRLVVSEARRQLNSQPSSS